MADVDWNWILRQLPYEGRKEQARTAYQNTIAQNAYQRSMLAAREGMDNQRLTETWHNQRQQLPGAYGRRGLLNSGIYKQGLGDFAKARQTAFDEQRFSYETQRGQLGVNDQAAQNQMNSAITGIEYDRVAQDVAYKQDLAQQLRGIM
jgi:hypothetical protein